MISLYRRIFLARPLVSLGLMLAIGAAAGYFVPQFKLDASADALVIENDPSLAYMRTINKRYGSQDYLFVTFSPQQDLFSDQSLNTLKKLRAELLTVRNVESINSLLDVPLLRSPPSPLSDLADNTRTLSDTDTDRKLARQEFISSPLYKNLLISEDGQTTAIQVNLDIDLRYQQLLEIRNHLELKKNQGPLSETEKQQLKQARKNLDTHKIIAAQQLHQDITAVRKIMDRYRDSATLHLGGVPMIADDMMTYVRSDIATFGVGVIIFLMLTLAAIFRRTRWVIVPLLCCGYSSLLVVGLLGFLDWRVTVISSNFISLVLIITLSVTIHLIVHYRELLTAPPKQSNLELISETVRAMFAPCLYTALTTMVAFSSLVVSKIVPVIDFGWMMVVGIAITFIVSFTLFPVLLLLLPKPDVQHMPKHTHPYSAILFGNFTLNQGNRIFIIALLALTFSVIGLSRLKVENSFIDYFDKSTEIYQGMTLIDTELGGTTPLEVIIRLPPPEQEIEKTDLLVVEGDDFFDDSEFEDTLTDTDDDPGKYWFTPSKVAKLHKIHEYLDQLPETGKVLSISTMMRIAESFNDDEALSGLELALVYSKLPEAYRKIVLNPYVSYEENEARFSIRVRESDRSLERTKLLNKIKNTLTSEYELNPEQVHLTGMLVMYNNMLRSLFKSQILTIGVVLAGIFIMFTLLFRSISLAILGILPNILSASLVLSIMGWANIPLDMMTITIAAITVGIGVDDTIHYIHRYQHEIEKDYDYKAALLRSHSSIGNAMYYTSITIFLGFSILTLSNFVPTIYFGLLTGLAMLIAMVANLTLLPQLLIVFKPFGKPERL